VFSSESIEVIKTPVRSPRANAVAERWVRTVRSECLDWSLIAGRRHLEQILGQYVRHYNGHRPHRGLGLAVPTDPESPNIDTATGHIVCHDVLGGLIHEYERVAASRDTCRASPRRNAVCSAALAHPWVLRSTPSEPRVAIENEGRRASLVHCLIVGPGRSVSALLAGMTRVLAPYTTSSVSPIIRPAPSSPRLPATSQGISPSMVSRLSS
jgi:hypothetical protein